MNWIELALAAQRIFLYASTTAVAGSIAAVLLILIEKIPNWKYSQMKMTAIKTALILFLLPLVSIGVVNSRRYMPFHRNFQLSELGKVVTLPMQKVYLAIMCIWLMGLIPGVVFRLIQYQKLKHILAENIPIDDETCKKLIERYKEKNHLNQVKFYQNDLICYPVAVNSFRPQIVLPQKKYTEKELHMILEHEMNHILRGDLIWKKLGLLVTFIHWWNPLAYILLEKLILQEEIECDIKTCDNNTNFTPREYGYYLSGMPEGTEDMFFASALCKSKKDLFKRLECMARRKKCKKWVSIMSCLILLIFTGVPSYAASEGIARANEKWIEKTEIPTEVGEIDFGVMESNSTVAEETDVEEIDLTLINEIESISTDITLDCKIKANTRVLYKWQDMQAGDEVVVSAKCSDSNIVYRIGIRDTAGNLFYRQGSGNMSHIFEISSDGEYTVFVENRSSSAMQVTGWVKYSN